MEQGADRVEVRLLGVPDVVVAGRTVEVASAKQQAVLVALALDVGATVPSDRLVDALWGDDPPESAPATLRGLVSRLRKAIGGDGGVAWLRGKGSGYVLDLEARQVDAVRFADLAAAGRAALANGDPAGGDARLCEALGLWRGPALGDVADLPFARAEARRLDDARLGAIEDLTDAELALGRPGDALARVEPHVAAHPLRERAWGQLMLALYRLGRQADALRAYQQLRHRLADELGIEPTPALRDLEGAILAQRPDLDVAPVASARIAPRDFGDTVAFLFTDIESSTRRWEGDQEAMAAALARHDKLLSEACGQWGGRVFSHTGDGLCAAFPTASAGIAAAVAGQQALIQEALTTGEAEPGEPLQVRMAVHAGAAECRAGNYFGPTLNRTARLMATAWGGQVVCSAAAADLSADQLPGPVGLLDLGEHRLADLARPERVFQITHPGLPAEFAPLRVSAGHRNNLPVALTSFVGRSGEMGEVIAALGRSRLVTLAGPGGAGKTRLALQSVAALLGRFPDGVWLCDLTPLRDPDLVAPEVAGAVGLDTGALAGSGRPFTDALCDALRHRSLLLVMDNCEHLVEPAARLAHGILATAPKVTVLATSREVLGVPGETVVLVGPLSLPPADATRRAEIESTDAVSLFCARSAESTPGFELTDANAASVARICHRLDGAPLALELAAARMRLLGARHLAERLDDRFRLLAGGPRTADPRHQTLRATIDWSHDLLAETERVVLRRLSVFPSDFDLDAAEAVAGGTGELEGPDGFEVMEIVGRLADKSLVVAVRDDEADVRYRLLETVRQYATEKLDAAGEAAATRDRHRDFFLSLTSGWIEEIIRGRFLWRTALEYDNFRAALEWSKHSGNDGAVLGLATALYHHWLFSGMADGIPWLEQAITVPVAVDPYQAAHARAGLVFLRENILGGRDDRDRALLDEALRIAVEHGDAFTGAWARLRIAELAAARGEREECASMVARAVELFRAHGYPEWEGQALALAAWDLMGTGEYSGARVLVDRALALVGDSFVLRPQILGQAALVEAAAGEQETAETHVREAVEVARGVPGRQVLVMALVRSAEVTIIGGRPEQARPPLDELLALLRDLGAHRWVAETLELAAVVLAQERAEAAAALLGAAVALRHATGEHRGGLAALSDRLRTCEATVLAALGEPADPEHRRRGAALHLTEVLAYARAELRAAGVR